MAIYKTFNTIIYYIPFSKSIPYKTVCNLLNTPLKINQHEFFENK